jgi:hypothetical protein
VNSDSREGQPDCRAMQSKWPKNGPAIDASPWVGPLGVGRCPSIAGRLDQGPRQRMKVGGPRSRFLERWPACHDLHLRPGGGRGGLRLTTKFLTISA